MNARNINRSGQGGKIQGFVILHAARLAAMAARFALQDL